MTVDFSHDTDIIEVDHAEEGRFSGGRWIPGRVLNGDERLLMLPANGVGAVRIRLLRIAPQGPDNNDQPEDSRR